ncbi:chromosome segregation protein SMC [Arcanobacterium pluranimalium]|uniref:chromosome segregation protein SMC n=1 Tax=Arcanobacterium pluranimalium TaxID=108028 RepID=UPI001EF89221
MRFEPGINCVVGPNGSGKSNVVDALAWVMGEQGAKNLRGGNMADVIFAGTSKRLALGRAEVSLTIDNTDGALPIEFSEVTITRTLFRSGGSEYAINGTACRLLDIQELLSDTGMGKEMHVIIGQGRLDQVLTATPEERRNFVEEAAGVLKHRRRKEKALRKLESMHANLVRIEDLASELRRQLGPLARQAETARRAQVIQRDVFDARARLLADDAAQAQARLTAQTSDDGILEQQKQELAEKLLACKKDISRLQQAADEANPHIAGLTEQWQRLNSLVERFRSLSQLANERHRSLSTPSAQINRGESPEHIRERAAQAREQEEEFTKEVSKAEESLREAISQREKAEHFERGIDAELLHINRTLADRRENAARLSGQLSTAQSRVEALTNERQRVQAAIQAAQKRSDDALAQVSLLEQDIVAHTDGDDTLSIAHEEVARELQEADDAVEAARLALNEAKSLAVEWKTKAATLALSLAPEDATAWAHDTYRNGIRGLVRDKVRILAGWEAAVEAALAGVAGGAVVDSIADAVDALRAAREAQAGHLELLITHTAPLTTDAEHIAERALKDSGFAQDTACLATSVIDPNSPVADVVTGILAGTVLCVDLVTAKALLELGAPRVATLLGDVLTAQHAWGGEVNQGAILARQATYDDAVAQAAKANEELQRAQERLDKSLTAHVRAKEEFDSVSSQLNARDSQLAAVTAQLGVLRQSLKAAQDEVERNVARDTKIGVELEARNEECERIRKQQELVGAEPTDIEARVQELNSQRTEAHTQTVSARATETEARLMLRTREERLRAIAGKSEALENSAQAVEARIAQEERAAVRRQQLAKIAQKVGDHSLSALQRSQELLEKVTAQRQEAEASRSERDSELSAARRRLDDLQAQERQLNDLQHRQDMVIAELTLKFEQLAAKAIDDLGMEVRVLIEEFGPHLMWKDSDGVDQPFVREQQEKRLARAERDLARLGKINPLALEEHAALEERQKYLTEQLQDLRKSRDDLLKIVRDIDARVDEVMTAAFADVEREFSSTFARLFPGGEGRLVLTDPQSVLTTGIEIEARPPGKRVKRLSLLSGGERSLTAVAFLVAIFKARPSPFYVMDEVEAALDDVNLSRLLDIFKELQESSQLLVITHQKRTMEIADALYGVAMKEQGVTTVISQRLKDVVPQ